MHSIVKFRMYVILTCCPPTTIGVEPLPLAPLPVRIPRPEPLLQLVQLPPASLPLIETPLPRLEPFPLSWLIETLLVCPIVETLEPQIEI